MSKKPKIEPKPDTVITLTLPGEGGIERTGSLIIKRGDLAQICQFQYSNLGDIADAIGKATEGLVELAATPLPVIKTTEADVYKPDLEAKRKLLQIDTPVKTNDGQEGKVLPQPIENDDPHLFAVDIVGRTLVGYYHTGDLTIVKPQPAVASAVDPLTVKPDVKKSDRPATDVSPVGEAPAQLSMF